MIEMKLVKVKKVTDIFDKYHLSERKNKFFEIEEEPEKVFFYCPCDIEERALAHIDIKNNHRIENREPLTIKGHGSKSSLKVTHGKGFCHFDITNGQVIWHFDSTNPRK